MRRAKKAKLFIKRPSGDWEEIKGDLSGDALTPQNDARPVEIPGLRDFVASFSFGVSPLVAPPDGCDPARN